MRRIQPVSGYDAPPDTSQPPRWMMAGRPRVRRRAERGGRLRARRAFGTFLTPRAADPDGVVALAQLTEDAGLDLVTVQDHPYQPRFLDAWTLLSVIAARTHRVRVAPNVANLPLRLPAVLARSAASLDLLSGGRVELGLGAGAFWEAIAANGGPHRSPGESVEALAEAIEAVRAGRSPAAIRRLYNLSGSFDADGNGFLRGPERVWAAQLRDLTGRHGISGFILASDAPDDIRRFADVAALVRDSVRG